MKINLEKALSRIRPGYSEWECYGKRYGVSKTTSNSGKSLKVYAEELGGNDIISFNFYTTKTGNHLRPCEMAKQKVIDFLAGMQQV